jgi:hypothetical protein
MGGTYMVVFTSSRVPLCSLRVSIILLITIDFDLEGGHKVGPLIFVRLNIIFLCILMIQCSFTWTALSIFSKLSLLRSY